MGSISMRKEEQNSTVQQLKSNLMGLGLGNYLISVCQRRTRRGCESQLRRGTRGGLAGEGARRGVVKEKSGGNTGIYFFLRPRKFREAPRNSAAPSRIPLGAGRRSECSEKRVSGRAGYGEQSPELTQSSSERSEAKRLELERKLMEYKKSDTYLMKLKYMKLQNYLQEVVERQNGALLRNQALFKELDQLEARMKTSGSAMIQKMHAMEEKLKELSLQEGNLSAEGDEQRESSEQLLRIGRQTGMSTQVAMLRGLCHPATVFMGYHRSAVLAAGGLGPQQKPLQLTGDSLAPDLPSFSPAPGSLDPESRSTDSVNDASVEGAVRCGDLAVSEEVSEQLISSASNPKPATHEEEQPQGRFPGPKPHQSDQWAHKEASGDSSTSDEGVMLSTPDLPQGMTLTAASGEQDKDAHATEDFLMQPPTPLMGQEEPFVVEAPDGYIFRHGRTLVGPSPVLQLIEDAAVRMSLQHRVLYQHLRTMGTAELLSFCHRADSLKEDDLEACEAVVLHQLQALLQSKLNGGLLPEETLDAKGTALDEKQTRPLLLWDMDVLQTRLSHHAFFLKKHQVQLSAEVAGMFDSLLASSETLQDGQALPALREVFQEEHGDRSSLQGNESSYSLPAIPNDSSKIKPAKQAPGLDSAGGKGWESDNSSRSKGSQEMHSQTSSSSKERSPPLSRPEIRRRVETAIKSKAFWGESDDSSSEIEAALRPQTSSPEADDFDDFYD
ncbi:centrosomal protein kizuna isoform X2 [Pogoniulus pusillus]|uniref:centrosomal protein kizuna isoform X2 n=1 Tax=Pogoniulus pusillus TaxID=488313 RepID=UPI0030B93502